MFAYFFIPQIFFYGMDSLLGAILNVRGRFGANMWTPVINNVVVIFVGILFFVTVGKSGTSSAHHLRLRRRTARHRHHARHRHPVDRAVPCHVAGRLQHEADLRLPPRGDRRDRPDVGLDVRLRVQPVARQPGGDPGSELGRPPTHGISAYANAYQLFQLPYAIIGISVISALLPRMSGHANDRRYSLVREDFSKGVRLASVIVVPAAVFLAVLGAPLCEFLFGHGHTSLGAGQVRRRGIRRVLPRPAAVHADAAAAAGVLLVPARAGPRPSSAWSCWSSASSATWCEGRRVARPDIVVGLAFAFDIMTLAGAVIAWPLLLRRVGSLDGWRITRSLVRMFIATIPGLLFAFVVMAVARSFVHHGPRLRPGRHGSGGRRCAAALRALLPDPRHRGVPYPHAVRRRDGSVSTGMPRVRRTR